MRRYKLYLAMTREKEQNEDSSKHVKKTFLLVIVKNNSVVYLKP